jgi:hypothetical protein
MERRVGATTVLLESMVKCVVEALLENVLAPPPVKTVVELNRELPVIVPAKVCADALSKNIVPVLPVVVPLFV